MVRRFLETRAACRPTPGPRWTLNLDMLDPGT
jgi:hypothetical protein